VFGLNEKELFLIFNFVHKNAAGILKVDFQRLIDSHTWLNVFGGLPDLSSLTFNNMANKTFCNYFSQNFFIMIFE
jgi:hypothetical protein